MLRKPLLFALGLVFGVAHSFCVDINLAQGLLAGEVTATSVILQTRLTATEKLADGDVPGAAGVARFEIAEDPTWRNARVSDWLTARASGDYIVKAVVAGLKPGTQYWYRAVYGPERTQTRTSAAAHFRTLPAANAAAPVNFVLTSCLNYSFFQEGTKGKPGYQGADRALGYPALVPLAKLAPDFVIFDGDCVYYDHPVATRAQTTAQLRKKWHEQYVQPRFLELFARTATYWMKDDHDYRMNDSDPTGDYAPSHELGIATFREQAPVADPTDPKAVTYRTHRIGRDLQLWMVEGRDYRSANRMPDGPDKSIWGAQQKAWLERTLQQSDATFKILVSPTPLVGPDDGSKRDNHVNPRGFRHEGEAFLAWLKANGFRPEQFFIVTGDRHWKFHSQHPSGFHELACGTLNRENSRMGRPPGDPESTDPQGLVRQLYTDQEPSGGFLQIRIEPGTGNQRSRIVFTHFDDTGRQQYEFAQTAP